MILAPNFAKEYLSIRYDLVAQVEPVTDEGWANKAKGISTHRCVRTITVETPKEEFKEHP